MNLKRPLQITALVVAVGAVSFFVGSLVGPRAQLAHLNVEAEENGQVSAYLSVYDTAWPAREIAEAICSTRSELDYFLQTYALTGPGSHYIFTCAEPGKETL